MTAMGAIANPSGSAVPISVLYLNSATRASVLSAPQTVATLPTCNAAAKGARAYITDSNVAFAAAAVGGAVGGAGANQAPVYCDGAGWKYGANDNIPEYLRRKFA
jgi:hypothetical protein